MHNKIAITVSAGVIESIEVPPGFDFEVHVLDLDLPESVETQYPLDVVEVSEIEEMIKEHQQEVLRECNYQKDEVI